MYLRVWVCSLESRKRIGVSPKKPDVAECVTLLQRHESAVRLFGQLYQWVCLPNRPQWQFRIRLSLSGTLRTPDYESYSAFQKGLKTKAWIAENGGHLLPSMIAKLSAVKYEFLHISISWIIFEYDLPLAPGVINVSLRRHVDIRY